MQKVLTILATASPATSWRNYNDAHFMSVASKAKFGPYEIRSLCGAGGMGGVLYCLGRRHP